jgi:hypothetical protein
MRGTRASPAKLVDVAENQMSPDSDRREACSKVSDFLDSLKISLASAIPDSSHDFPSPFRRLTEIHTQSNGMVVINVNSLFTADLRSHCLVFFGQNSA